MSHVQILWAQQILIGGDAQSLENQKKKKKIQSLTSSLR